jgi:hypothetical protein
MLDSGFGYLDAHHLTTKVCLLCGPDWWYNGCSIYYRLLAISRIQSPKTKEFLSCFHNSAALSLAWLLG